jgi:hypothetical protein
MSYLYVKWNSFGLRFARRQFPTLEHGLLGESRPSGCPYECRRLQLTSVLTKQPFDAACVPMMEQWSMGRFVAGWDAAVQKETPAVVPTTASQ